ncbi:MAG: InlB B-repeat-containing protein, partial [Clostridia bacterium]|nr:InlB B-repeat-containing protein [Clostridia bacterium]
AKVGETNIENEDFIGYEAELVLGKPIRTGFTFAGWSFDGHNTDTMYVNNELWSSLDDENEYITGKQIGAESESVIVKQLVTNDSVTIIANWTINQYTITFDLAGGKIGEETTYSITADYGSSVSVPENNPKRTGYEFAGWDKEIPATMPAENVTITAKWTINQYTITFDLAGGKIGEETTYSITADYGSDVTAPADPEKEGYTFAGWDKEIPATMPAKDVTITAKWTINTYKIIFNNEDGTKYEEREFEYNASIVVPVDPEKTGYTFTGWTPSVPTTMPAENLIVTATFEINQYTITFVNTGDTTIAPITQDYGTAVTAPADPEKEGYTFNGWDKEIPTSMPAEDLTVTASWTVNQYTITFANTGDTTIAPITQDYGTAVTAPANPEKEGYTFAGWTPSLPTEMPAEDLTVTATWVKNGYIIEYVDVYTAGDKLPNKGEFDTNVEISNPSRVGYEFAGWVAGTIDKDGIFTIDSNFNKDKALVGGVSWNGKTATKETIFKNLTAEKGETITLTATWTINTYKITFNNEDGTLYKEKEFEYNESIVAPAGPEKTGYTFNGWTPSVPATMPAGDLIVTATFKINQYTITFNLDGGKIEEETTYSITQNYGTAVTSPSNPTKIGYTFTGWDKEIPATMPAEDVEITATWTAITYSVTTKIPTVKIDGTLDLENTTNTTHTDLVFDNENQLNIGNPQIVGYNFIGWVASFGDDNSQAVIYNTETNSWESWYGTATTATSFKNLSSKNNDEVIITATFNAKQYTVTVNGENANVSIGSDVLDTDTTTDTFTATTGNSVNVYAKPHEGYHGKDGSNYTIEFVLTSGKDGEFNKNIIISSVQESANGYFVSVSGFDAEWTLTVKAKVNTYYVSFNGNGHTGGTTVMNSFTYESTIDIPDCGFNKTGYTFNKWVFDNNGADVSGEYETAKDLFNACGYLSAPENKSIIQIRATWIENTYNVTVELDGGKFVNSPEGFTKVDDDTYSKLGIKYESETITLLDPEKTGYIFNGWTVVGTDNGTSTTFTKLSAVKNDSVTI